MTVAVRYKVPPFSIVALVLFSVTPVTEVLTVTSQVAVLPPSAVVTLIVAVPFAFAVTTPSLVTVATPVSLLLHITFLLLASLGMTVAVRYKVPPFSIVALVLFSVTPVTKGVHTAYNDRSSSTE